MTPEDSIRAHLDLGAKTLLPIHWGTFELSYHDWDEPIRRAMKAAKSHEVDMVTPMLGQTFVFGEPFQSQRWWEEIRSN
jgi:L-ascorbate metabolism protein UlaG (beta-lactamase superfamily)